MKKELAVFLLACASVLCCSCKDGLLSNGPLKTDDYELDKFRVIEMRDNINVTLKRCDQTNHKEHIHVEAGENIFDNINVDVHGDTLTLSNGNSYNYLRPYNDAIEMTVYFDSIYKVIFCSNGTLKMLDTIKGISTTLDTYDTIHQVDTVIDLSGDTIIQLTDSLFLTRLTTFEIDIEDGSGTINILTDCQRLKTGYYYGTACIYGKGYAGYAQTYASHNAHGIIDYRELENNIHSITYNGTNRVFVKVLHDIIANNNNNGEIHFMKYVTTTEELVLNDSLHHYDTVVVSKLRPENIHYNGDYISVWRYNDTIPGLKGHRIY